MSTIARMVGGPKDSEEVALTSPSPWVSVEKAEVESTVPFKLKRTRGRYVRTEVTLYRWAGWEDEGTDELPSDRFRVGPLEGPGD